jgi:hypothetical protein
MIDLLLLRRPVRRASGHRLRFDVLNGDGEAPRRSRAHSHSVTHQSLVRGEIT